MTSTLAYRNLPARSTHPGYELDEERQHHSGDRSQHEHGYGDAPLLRRCWSDRCDNFAQQFRLLRQRGGQPLHDKRLLGFDRGEKRGHPSKFEQEKGGLHGIAILELDQ